MYDELFHSLFEIVTFFNRPKQDKILLKKAGIEIDTALFPIVVRVSLQKKIGIVELADQLGRDHSTVSRQVDKLEVLEFVMSDVAKSDSRVREIRLSEKGRKTIIAITKARRSMMKDTLASWSEAELGTLQDSLRHLANDLTIRSKNK